MILNARIHGEAHCATTWPDMSALITEAMENLRPEQADIRFPGEIASFMFAEKCFGPVFFGNDWPDNILYVTVNTETGFGGLTWLITEDGAARISAELDDYVWVSDNPAPPDFDPRVVGDTGHPTYYSPRSTLPAPQVRAALEEFCRVGTGARPDRIGWVPGEMNGQRLDELP